jgi:oligosaccharide repeat unit polymerase
MVMTALPLVVGNLVVNNPLAAARYWTVTVLLGWFAPHFLRSRRTAAALLVGMILAMAVLPGLGSSGRHARSASELLDSLKEFVSPAEYLAYSGDFAEYACLAQSLVWTQKFELQGGRQLLGGLFFFVPRSVWPNKAIGTGAFVAHQMHFEFGNVASTIVAEPLVDFGWLGVPIYAAVFAWILAYLDRLAWRQSRERLLIVDVLYPFLVGAMFIMTRGDFLVSYSLILGLMVATLPLVVGSKRAGAGSTPALHEGEGELLGDDLLSEKIPGA